MRISLLLQREPLGKILEETLSEFFQSRTGHHVQVKWFYGRSKVSVIQREQAQVWLCNIYLNAIFEAEADTAVFDPVRREYGRSTRCWRRPAQKVYMSLASSRMCRQWAAHAALGVTPALAGADQQIIVPGNHKLRVLDRSSSTAYAVLKNGFNPRFVRQEIDARRRATDLGLPVAPITSVSHDGRWFQEPYILGTPLNRLADPVHTGRARVAALNAARRLAKHTLRAEPLDTYVEQLANKIRAQSCANRLIESAVQQMICCDLDVLLAQIDAVKPAVSASFATALTHGDFQPGNVLVDDERLWLIDWEYSERRQAAYDGLVWLLRSRFPAGLSSRLAAFIASPRNIPKWLESWPGFEARNQSHRRLCALIFLLEEFVFHLEENANPRFTRLGRGLQLLMAEWSTFLADSSSSTTTSSTTRRIYTPWHT